MSGFSNKQGHTMDPKEAVRPTSKIKQVQLDIPNEANEGFPEQNGWTCSKLIIYLAIIDILMAIFLLVTWAVLVFLLVLIFTSSRQSSKPEKIPAESSSLEPVAIFGYVVHPAFYALSMVTSIRMANSLEQIFLTALTLWTELESLSFHLPYILAWLFRGLRICAQFLGDRISAYCLYLILNLIQGFLLILLLRVWNPRGWREQKEQVLEEGGWNPGRVGNDSGIRLIMFLIMFNTIQFHDWRLDDLLAEAMSSIFDLLCRLCTLSIVLKFREKMTKFPYSNSHC